VDVAQGQEEQAPDDARRLLPNLSGKERAERGNVTAIKCLPQTANAHVEQKQVYKVQILL
jgi:hypothetical protein